MKMLLGLSLMLFGILATGQHTVDGKVINESGEPLPGATINVQNTNSGTVTDLQGQFSLELESGSFTLEVSYVGYEPFERTYNIQGPTSLEIILTEDALLDEEVIVYATRANEKTPTTFSTISDEKLAERNLGQDIPILLNFSPSVVTTSDAGAGVGYTGIRIRGSDATRINVTINGIPINDSESHGMYWVNMPDFATNVQSVQVQRGVGTSSNGAAAFGATVNLQTNGVSREAYAQLDNSFGSFNTIKNNIQLNTGLIDDKFNFEGRLSRISSDGYIDRSGSDLSSYYLAGGYYGENTLIKAVVFGGKEITQQAWYGTPEARLTGNQEDLEAVINLSGEYGTQEQVDNLLNSDRRFNYYLYDNEVDNYSQDHYQLLINQALTQNLNFAGAIHYTYGRGYFEQYRYDEPVLNYSILDTAGRQSNSTDLIRQRWLDNDFYGFTYSFNYNNSKLQATLGGGYNIYDGDHFGEIIWARNAGNTEIGDRYYQGNGIKKDFNSYLKINYQLLPKLNAFGDLQVRTIDYVTSGIDNDQSAYDVDVDYVFFNPKVGLTYDLRPGTSLYASYSVGNREPVRSDFIDAPTGEIPSPETLHNIEAGVRKYGQDFSYQINYYLMNYQDQLVLTGALNDVGASIRTNVPNSYRTGIEISGAVKLAEGLIWSPNLTLSQNKIQNFTEVVYDYFYTDERYLVENEFEDTDISFSPNVIAGSDLSYSVRGFTAQLLSKYVGKQYLDNTGNEDRVIDPYFINDVRLAYDFSILGIENIGASLLINNIFDVKYSSNGYTWGYLYEGFLYQQNNFYPQAGINFLAGLSVRF